MKIRIMRAWEKQEIARASLAFSSSEECQNLYIDLRGHVRPARLPSKGMYRYDGQVFYRVKRSS